MFDVSEPFRCYFEVFSIFFRCFYSMFCLSILCLFYIFAFLCFVVLRNVIDPVCLCAHLFIHALQSATGERLASQLLFVVSHCKFAPFPLVSLIRCGT